MAVVAFAFLWLENKDIKRIIDMMAPFNKLAFSLCSTVTKDLIRTHCLKGPQLCIRVQGNIYFIEMDLLPTGSDTIHLRMVRSLFKEEKLFVVKEDLPKGYLTMKEFGVRDWIQHIAYVFNQQMIWCLEFRSDIHNMYTFQCLKEAIRPLPVGSLKTSSICSNGFILYVLKEFREAEQVLMARNPYEDRISIRNIWLSNLHVVRVENDCSFSLNDLLASNVLNIYTIGRYLTQKSLNHFFKLWMAGANPKLESLQVFYRHHIVLDSNQILKGIAHKIVEGTTTRVHKRTDKSNKRPPLFTGGYDIKRRDGTMGTLVFNSPYPAACRFVVWHLYLNDDPIL